MTRALIIGGGDSSLSALKFILDKQFDIIIACDSGAELINHIPSLTKRLTHLIGDFDSISHATLELIKRTSNCQIVKLEEDKDFSDLEFAGKLVLQNNPSEIILNSCFGNRLDFSILNFTYIFKLKLDNPNINILAQEDDYQLLPLLPQIQHEIICNLNQRFSLLPVSEMVENLTIAGAKWELNNCNVRQGSSRTISNRSNSELLKIKYTTGELQLLIWG